MLFTKTYFKLTLIGILYLSSNLCIGQVGINTTAPHISAMLHVNAANKGVLFPNVALTSHTDVTTITSPETGLIAYNTGAAGLAYVGLLTWNGTVWQSLTNTSIQNGTITDLNCDKARLDAPAYTNGVPYSGTLTIPYKGGNGGLYPGQTFTTTSNLTATLQAGNFNQGSGNLVFTITGTPNISSPNTSAFIVNIGGQTCTAIVGQGYRSFIEEYAQVTFEGWATTNYPAEAVIDPGSKNIARVVKLNKSVYRIDFITPFEDTSYITSGYCFEQNSYQGDNEQPYLYAPNFVYNNYGDLGTAANGDTDMAAGGARTNPAYNLDTVETFTQGPYTYMRTKYKTHFYIVEGYGAYFLTGGALSVTR